MLAIPSAVLSTLETSRSAIVLSMDMSQPANLRHLVACVSCHRQFDASGRERGSRFHCPCGELVEVLEPRAHESAVVRCSSCGAPRIGSSTSCRFCASDFTLHERDLDTICPGCATRISRRARFCHACALPITLRGDAGEVVDARCPRCGVERRLVSRALGTDGLSVLECPGCAGLWLSGTTFQLLERGARERQLNWTPERGSPDADHSENHAETKKEIEPMYRPCPDCRKLMNRRNYGRRSGVIIDVCSEHGVWFDLDELAHILAWIRDGGLARAQELELESAKVEARRATASSGGALFDPIEPRGPTLATLLDRALRALFG